MREPLLSIGQLCDAGCNATFTNHDVHVTLNGDTILTGYRDPATRLWRIPIQDTNTRHTGALPPPTTHALHNVYEHTRLSAAIQYMHAAAGSPVTSTWMKAIQNGHYASWPNLTCEAVKHHLPKSVATIKGHQDQQRQHIRSTQPKPTSTPNDTDDFTPTTPIDERTHHVFATTYDLRHEIATDLTGRFPIHSSDGFKYLFVLYDFDSNAIIVRPMRNRTAQEHVRVYNDAHQYLCTRGCTPKLQKLDNEASTALKTQIRDHGIDFQLAPPHIHRRNAAERAIRTFKNHFIAILCSTDKQFPMRLWPELLPHAQMTLNMLRATRINPKISAYDYLNGPFDYNRTPLAPPGTQVIVHEKAHQRGSWAPHGVDGWYLGPAMEHYRCHTVHINKFNSTRVADTVEFFPQHVPMPHTSSTDAAIHAAKQLIEALQHTHVAGPLTKDTNTRMEALTQLATIFANTYRKHTTSLPPRVRKTPGATPRNMPTVPTTAASTNPVSAPPLPVQYANHVATIKPNAHPIPVNMDTQPTMFIPEHFMPEICNAVIDETTGKTLEYRDLIKIPEKKPTWERSFANELGRLAQGIRDQVGTDTCFFIHKHEVPADRVVTYGRIVTDIRPQKAEPERTRLTVGGNLIDYPGNTSAKTADLTTAKLLINSTISNRRARFMGIDIKNFYLGTPMKRYEYMRLHISLIPEEIIQHYNLKDKVNNGYVYIEIRRGMYGLPQAGIIAQELLIANLAKHGYTPVRHTHGLWRHETRNIKFCLVVDDFGVKYTNRADAQHLIDSISTYYQCTVDWDGKLYCGVTLEWHYKHGIVYLSIPGYVRNALHKFQHPTTQRPFHAPSHYTAPTYSTQPQLSTIDTTDPLDPTQKLTLQQVVGTFLFYARAVDPTMLHELNRLGSSQSKGTQATAEEMVHFLNYCATHPDAQLCFHASDMILHVHSDASYLTEADARSRAGGHFFLNGHPSKHPATLNGPILAIAKILRHVMSSAAESEMGALFLNCKEAVPIRIALIEMGHPQPATPVQVDNSTACGIANRTVKQVRSKAMDMRFYWVQDRIDQQQFHVFWAPGRSNIADYYTKHHPIYHHREMRKVILNTPQDTKSQKEQLMTHELTPTIPTRTNKTELPALPSLLRGCADSRPNPYLGTRKHAGQPWTDVSIPDRYQKSNWKYNGQNGSRIQTPAE